MALPSQLQSFLSTNSSSQLQSLFPIKTTLHPQSLLPDINIVWAVVAIIACWLLFKVSRIGRRESFLPPGPPTVMLLGNLNIVPHKDLHLKFSEWAQEYGEIYSLKFGPGTSVVLTSPKTIHEILDKNTALTADRPSLHMAYQVHGPNNHLVNCRYSDAWKSLRRAAREILTPQACRNHLAIQKAEATQLSYDLMTHPDDFADSIRRYAHSVILSVLYGKRVPQFTTPGAQQFFDTMHRWVNLLAPGVHPPVDMIPILQKVPERFARWKTIAKEIRKAQRSLYFGLLRQVETRIAAGTRNGCFMETVCDQATAWNLNREQVGYLGGVMIEAGSDTTSAILQSLVLLLMANPQVQAKAWKEIDEVVGHDRMPNLDDLDQLPYVQAIVLETHRSRTVNPFNFPHVASSDLKYGGYVIPKGATIFANTWGVYHDPNVFPDPERFYPERFLGTEGVKGVDIMKLAFGNGRRSCPGIHLARNAVFLNAMNLLWGFDLGKPLDSSGKEIEPNTRDYAVGISFTPNPFKCRFTPRTPHHAETIRRELRSFNEAFKPFEQDLVPEDRKYVLELRERL